jgi:hypothetical protein
MSTAIATQHVGSDGSAEADVAVWHRTAVRHPFRSPAFHDVNLSSATLRTIDSDPI